MEKGRKKVGRSKDGRNKAEREKIDRKKVGRTSYPFHRHVLVKLSLEVTVVAPSPDPLRLQEQRVSRALGSRVMS